MAALTEELLLIDAEDNKEYKIIVSSEDAEKARGGTNVINIIIIILIFSLTKILLIITN